jgi:hypothetical protein
MQLQQLKLLNQQLHKQNLHLTQLEQLKLFNQQLPKVQGTVSLTQQNIGHAFILGHPTNGKIGTGYLGTDGQQIRLGTSSLGAATITRVVSLNDTFVEPLRDTTYVDSSNTTAIVDTTLHTITF